MGKIDAWFPHYPGDNLRDTQLLSDAAYTAYGRLKDHYWGRKELPDNNAALARLAGFSEEKFSQVRQEIEHFFKIDGGVWRHQRLDTLYADQEARHQAKQAKARKAAQTRWGSGARARKNAPSNATSIDDDMPEECPSYSSSSSSSDSSKSSSTAVKAPPSWNGPDWIWNEVCRALGPERAKSHIALARWNEHTKTITTLTEGSWRELWRLVPMLRQRGVQVYPSKGLTRSIP